MKKLLAFALVLGIASLASAAVQYDLSLNGSTEITQVWIMPSETVTVDVHATYGEFDSPADFWIGMVRVDTGDGEWLWGTEVIGPGAGDSLDQSALNYGDDYIFGYYPTAPAPGSWADGMVMSIEFHCLGVGEGNGDILIQLYDPTGYIVIDEAVIHQIPEPASLALLLKSSSSPVRTVLPSSYFSTMARPSVMASVSVLAQ